MTKKRVILVTDGDKTAARAVKAASRDLDLEIISNSQGTPTSHSGSELVEVIIAQTGEPVVVMVDDNGEQEVGPGEEALRSVLKSEKTQILGVLAVASNTKEAVGIIPDVSITKAGEVVNNPPVNKQGELEAANHLVLEGDTVDVLNQFPDLLIVGIGDLGKMEGEDDWKEGAPITKKGLKEILIRSDGADEN